MKRFKTNKKIINIKAIILIILLLVVFTINNINNNISYSALDIAKSKISEITINYLKKDITPKNIDINKLINITKNENQEIMYMDINMNYAYEIMNTTVSSIQKNINKLINGEIETNKELQIKNNHPYILIPTGLSKKGVLFSNLGPKIPIGISFYEHALGTITTEATNYGINNSLIKVYLIVTIESKLLIPNIKNKISNEYKVLLCSSFITGKVPSLYNGTYEQNSSLVSLD